MVGLIRKNIRNKMLLIVASSFTFIFVSVVWGFMSLNQVIENYSVNVNRDVRQMVELSDINLTFKTQVQEWKNTLIRGKDPKQREKYWGRFNQHGTSIQKKYQALLEKMHGEHPAYESLRAFADVYPDMMTAYKSGYRAYVESGYDIPVADKAVSGIDRKPTQFLSEALIQAERDVASTREIIESDAAFTRNVTLYGVILATLLSLGIFVFFVETRLIAPLDKVTGFSRSIAKGDFTVRFETKSQDQIGKLADSFRRIQQDLGGIVGGVLTDLSELTRLIDTLLSAFNNIKSSLGEQMTESHTLQGNMQQMLKSSQGISGSVNEANEFIRHSANQVNQGIDMFEQNLSNSKSMSTSANQAATIIDDVKQDADEIGNIVSVISGIAEQTNLLALNAAIEAARAGENGRGFAVVADEVRALATKTQESTTQISATIAALQTATDNAFNAMKDGRDKATTSLEQTQQAQQFMQALGGAFDEVSRLNSNVEDAAQHQVSQASEVNNGLQEINYHSDQSRHEAAVMEDASKVLAEILERIRETTAVFKLSEGAGVR